MRPIPPGLAAHIGEGATTLCRCWTLTRRDGHVFGFTDHDRDLVVAGRVHAARTGLEAASFTGELGFAVGGGDVAGALTSDAITEADIGAGLYDGASVELRLVNWADPGQAMLLASATIGEIRREDGSFVAELRGPLHRFDEERGRVFKATCSADLGDARCGIALDQANYVWAAAVSATDGALTVTATTFGHVGGWFTGGRLTWQTGANAGSSIEVKRHWVGQVTAGLELWQRAPKPIAVGDVFRVTAGCDKRHATCRDRFANVANFRGFPHMPGNDFVLARPIQGDAGLDGGSLFQ